MQKSRSSLSTFCSKLAGISKRVPLAFTAIKANSLLIWSGLAIWIFIVLSLRFCVVI
nr:MAG TPA_asm: hypothetical protein [Caudoviricetes sp.]